MLTNDKYLKTHVKDSELMLESSLRTIAISDEQGIRAVVGKLKSNAGGGTQIQAYLFSRDKWTAEAADEWIDSHGLSAEWILGKKEYKEDDNLSEGDEHMTMPLRKMFNFEIKSVDEEKRTFTAIASTESKDRDGDIIKVSGWKLTNFKKNPVLLWGHNASIPPIGKVLEIWAEGDELKFTPQFMPAEMNPMSDQIFQMYKAGFLRSFSVRFDPVKWEDIQPEKAPKEGERVRMGRLFKEQELLEISCVNIPANPEALKSAELQDLVVKSFILDNSTAEERALITIPKKCCGCNSHDNEEKSGRVLSAKNIKQISESISHMKNGVTGLETLLAEHMQSDPLGAISNDPKGVGDVTEPKSGDAQDALNGLDKVVDELLKSIEDIENKGVKSAEELTAEYQQIK